MVTAMEHACPNGQEAETTTVAGEGPAPSNTAASNQEPQTSGGMVT